MTLENKGQTGTGPRLQCLLLSSLALWDSVCDQVSVSSDSGCLLKSLIWLLIRLEKFWAEDLHRTANANLLTLEDSDSFIGPKINLPQCERFHVRDLINQINNKPESR